VDRPERHLDVDPRVRGQHEAQLLTTLEDVLGDHTTEPREHAGQGRLGRRRRLVGPEDFQQLTARYRPRPARDEIAEEQPSLPAR